MMKLPPTAAKTQKAFQRLAEALASEGAAAGTMFGMPCLKACGKAFAGVFGDALVFKLRGDAHAQALALDGAQLFDPSGTGRAMKEWVVVPAAHAREWPSLGQAAVAYVTAAPEKAAAKKAAPKKTRRA